ncbi:MAG: hypothetical protein ACTTHG_07010 [Treponemataceae bacterium]
MLFFFFSLVLYAQKSTEENIAQAVKTAQEAQNIPNFDSLTEEQKKTVENGDAIKNVIKEDSENDKNIEQQDSQDKEKSKESENAKDEDSLDKDIDNSDNKKDKDNDKKKDSTTKIKKSIVTILNAQKTEYAKNEEGNDVIILTGSVKLDVEQDGIKTVISADKIIYNREKQRLFADGGVILEKMTAGKVSEKISAKEVLFNSETQEGVFTEGQVIQSDNAMVKLDNDANLVINSKLFGKDDSGVIGFKNAALTFCDEEDPHWKIRASRIWLLPGNEFAFLNAVFNVGYIPVLWLPFFYYPKDEMIFNPVLGYDKRKGYFLQTTTYIIGKKNTSNDKKSSNKDDFFNFLNSSSNKKKVREGLFLHSTDEEDTTSSANSLRFLADYYTNLGGMAGIEGSFSPKKIVTGIDFSTILGFSNTIFRNTNGYTIYDYSNGYKTLQDSGYFFGYKIPFRFYVNLKTTINYSPVNFTISTPIYSDPFFSSDFINDRKESMNWLSVVTNGLTDPKDLSTSLASGISSYIWSASLSVNPNFASLKPYLSSVSLSNVKSSILFSGKTNTNFTGSKAEYSPNRKFFYPSQVVPGSGTLNISGTIYSYNSKEKKAANKKNSLQNSIEGKMIKPDFDLKTIAEWDSPIDEEIAGQAKKTSQQDNSSIENESKGTQEKSDKILAENALEKKSNDKNTEDIYEKRFLNPLTVSSYKSSGSEEKFSYDLTYSIVPVVDSLITYDPNKATAPDKINFSPEYFQSTYYKISASGILGSSLSFFNNVVSIKNTLKFTPQYQKHPIISKDYYTTQKERDKIVLNDYSSHSLNLVNTNTVSIRPFYFLPIIDSSSVSWDSSINVIDTKFVGTVLNPAWDYKTAKWDKKDITTHTMNFNFVTKLNNWSQTFSFISNLPPQTDTYTFKLNLTFPFLSFSAESGLQRLTMDANGDGIIDKNFVPGKYITDFSVKPFKQNLSMNFFEKKFTFTQSFQYDIEEKHASSLTFAASMWGAVISYNMQYALPYELDSIKGWVAKNEKKFIPYSLVVSYNLPSKKYRWWKNRISFHPGLSTNITFDMVKPTNSYFTFVPSINFEINKILTLSFKATSRNDVIFRYFQDLYQYDVKVPGETNIFKDLFYSFDFFNDDHRRSSGFKLKSLAFSLTRELHDWDLKCEFKVEPRLITSKIPYYYDFSPYFSLSVIWKPMNTFKVQIQDEYGEWTINSESASK